MTLERRTAMAALMKDRADDLLVVPGLGSTTWDLAAVGDDPRNFYLWGAMGGAAMIGLGLALAQPARRVAVITGDGEMLMGLGSLATIGSRRPAFVPAWACHPWPANTARRDWNQPARGPSASNCTAWGTCARF